MDYVLMAEKADCVLESVIKSLHKFASPRRVLVVAPTAACARSDFSFAPNVQCVDENTVLPGVSKASTLAWLRTKFGKKVDDLRLGLGSHTMDGWYLQQFLKMGVSDVAEMLGLSDNYVLWDSDVILLRDYCPFNAQGQVTLMEGDTGPENQCNAGYQKSFERLTGLPYAYSGSNKGFTTHHMVINRHAMGELLAKIGQDARGQHWSRAILEASCPDLETCSCGFSEYGSYASWMKRQHPKDVAEVPLQYERKHHIWDSSSSCCPEDHPEYFEQKTRAGLLFVGIERSCRKDKNYVDIDKLPR